MKSGSSGISTPPAGKYTHQPTLIIVPPANMDEECPVDASYQDPTLWLVYLLGDPLVLLGSFDSKEEAEEFAENYEPAPS